MLKLRWLGICLAFIVLLSSTIVFAEESKQAINREQFAVVMAKTWGIQPFFPEEPTFTDLDPAQAEFGYVEALAKLGILVGGGEGKFLGEQFLTRQDTAVILYRALANNFFTNAQDIIYQDSAKISAYAQEAVSFVTAEGLMVGTGAKFLPKEYLTKKEASVLVDRLLARGNLPGDYFWGVAPALIELKVGEEQEIQLLSRQELLAYTPVFGFDKPELGTISKGGIFTAIKPGQGIITVNLGHRHHSIVVIVHE